MIVLSSYKGYPVFSVQSEGYLCVFCRHKGYWLNNPETKKHFESLVDREQIAVGPCCASSDTSTTLTTSAWPLTKL